MPDVLDIPIGFSANDFLMDDAIRNAIFSERFKTTAWRRVVGMLNRDVFPELIGKLTTRLERITVRGFDSGVTTTRRYQQMVQEMDEILRAGLGEARRLSVSQDLVPLARRQSNILLGQMEGAVPQGIGIQFNSPDATTLKSVVTARPFQGKLLREHYSKLDTDTRKRLRAAISNGISIGETTPQIVRRLTGTRANRFTDGVLQATRREATAITRTAVNHVSTHAREATYKANEDVIKGVLFIATLDNRTTFQCASLDGETFPINEGPRPPIHMQCRSTTSPILKSWKELGIDLKEAPAGTRASMNGQVPAAQNYQTWLRKQPKAFQSQVLGPARLKLFEQGKITSMKQLIGPTGRPLTLAQLTGRVTGIPTSGFVGINPETGEAFTQVELDRKARRAAAARAQRQRERRIVEEKRVKALEDALDILSN